MSAFIENQIIRVGIFKCSKCQQLTVQPYTHWKNCPGKLELPEMKYEWERKGGNTND